MSDDDPRSANGPRWAIVGAGGRIGGLLRNRLRERVASFLLIDRVPIDPVAPTEDFVQVDVSDSAALTLAIQDGQVDGIVHLGGLADEADFRDLVEVNLIGTYNVLEAARVGGVPRVIVASSNRVTGFYPVTLPLTSDLPARPDSFYGVSKAATETLCRLYVDKFGLIIACPRIGRFEDRPGSARELSTWVSPGDLARAFDAAMTATNYDFAAFYAVSRNRARWWDLAEGERLGFHPVDDAADHAAGLGHPLTTGRQGGDYTTAEYSLARKRS